MGHSHTLALGREVIYSRPASAALGVAFFILAMVLGAYVRIPLPGTPVPITLQTFFVVLSGAVLGKRLGLYSQAGYLLLGVVGLPVFQGYSSGISHFMGSTGGYLIGFVFASYIAGRLTETAGRPAIWRIILGFILGNAVIYTCGIAWLIYLYRIPLESAFLIGLLPFIPGEALKILCAASVFSGISSRTSRIFSVK
ncbi:MAG: biotin transporter BioY [Candidatus Omnitrophota bacterium]